MYITVPLKCTYISSVDTVVISCGQIDLTTTIIGASLSEPHINGKAMHELYIYYYGRTSDREIYDQYGSMDISAKYSFAHSHAWATGHSNLTNSKFTLVYSAIAEWYYSYSYS